ncbi:MAG: 6-phosphogluconolactonase [Terriglobales bacterium]
MNTTPKLEIKRLNLNGAEIAVFPAPPPLSEAAADEFFRVIYEAVKREAPCRIALAGGSTPKSLYTLIADRVDRGQARGIDWARVHLFFGDERCVPPDHPDSNYRMVRQSLLAHGLTAAVHRVQGELPPEEAAARYEEELREEFGNGEPHFDLVLLGLGPDGHTASLFPGSAALADRNRWVAANYVEKFKSWRITFTYPVLDRAAEAMFLVAGAEKADAVSQIFTKGADLPAAKVMSARRLWYLDAAAGAGLGR